MNRDDRSTACVLIIGNEILSGRTQDVNLAYIGTRLGEIGVRLAECRVIPDVESVIIETVNACRAQYDYVFTTGGIGPTHDDITADCIAKAFGVPLEQHPEARRIIETMLQSRGIEVNAARLRMANVPKGGTLIDNSISGAPGFHIGNVFVLAGVPKIMQAMFEGCCDRLDGGAPIQSRTVTAHLGEGTVAEPLAALQDRYPDVEIGSYPFYKESRFGTNLVLRATDPDQLAKATEEVTRLVDELGGAPQID